LFFSTPAGAAVNAALAHELRNARRATSAQRPVQPDDRKVLSIDARGDEKVGTHGAGFDSVTSSRAERPADTARFRQDLRAATDASIAGRLPHEMARFLFACFYAPAAEERAAITDAMP
jgi:hypothetical protein